MSQLAGLGRRLGVPHPQTDLAVPAVARSPPATGRAAPAGPTVAVRIPLSTRSMPVRRSPCDRRTAVDQALG